jgi:hypothetical protein
VAAGAAALEQEAPDTVATPATVADWLRSRHPGMRVEVHGSQRTPGAPYGSTFYDAEANEEGDDYASGMLLWTGSGAPVADVRLGGDSPPLTVRWLDFDGDGRKDAFVLWGGEDASGGAVYLDRAAGRLPDSAFVSAWTSGSEYASVLDLDGDGRPEIVQPDEWQGGETDEWPCTDLDVPPSIRTEASREYERLSRGLGDVTAPDPAGTEDGPAVMALWMPVRVYSVRGTRAVDVTREHAQHVGWRLGMLQRMRTAAGVSKGCAAELERVEKVMRERAGLPSGSRPEA